MGLGVAVSAEALSDVQFSIMVGLDHAIQAEVVLVSPCAQRPRVLHVMGPDPGELRM